MFFLLLGAWWSTPGSGFLGAVSLELRDEEGHWAFYSGRFNRYKMGRSLEKEGKWKHQALEDVEFKYLSTDLLFAVARFWSMQYRNIWLHVLRSLAILTPARRRPVTSAVWFCGAFELSPSFDWNRVLHLHHGARRPCVYTINIK